MDPISIGVAIFFGTLLFGSQQTKKEEGDKKPSSKQQQQPSSQQQRKPLTNKITKCPHCGGNLNDD